MKAHTTLKEAYHELNNEQKKLLRNSFLTEFYPNAGETYFYKAFNKVLPAEQFIWLLIRLNVLSQHTANDIKTKIPSAKIKRAVPVCIQHKEIVKARKRAMRKETGLQMVS